MKQFVSRSAICWSWLSKLVMSTSIKIENQSRRALLMPMELQQPLFLLSISNDCEERLLWKNVRKQNFNYCNESFWRGIESVAFVWSQQELILASSAMVIHHQRNNTVRGGEYDKKHEKGSERGRHRGRDTVEFLFKPKKHTNNPVITTVTNTMFILKRYLWKLWTLKPRPEKKKKCNKLFGQSKTQFNLSCIQKITDGFN